jgi:hypothetical protein
VLAHVWQTERVVDEEVLRVGRLAIRDHVLLLDTLRKERAHGRTGCRDAGDHLIAVADRHAAGAREQGLGRCRLEPLLDRCRDEVHPLEMLRTRDLLGS